MVGSDQTHGLGAVAVVDVEVDDGDAAGAMGALGVAGGDDGIAEEAEAHGLLGLGVVSRRAHGAEGIRGDSPAHHRVDRQHRRTGGARGRNVALRRQRRVAVEMGEALRRDVVADQGDVAQLMDPGDGLFAGGIRRAAADQILESFVGQRLLDHAQPVRPLGMPVRHEVLEKDRIADEERWQALGALLSSCGRGRLAAHRAPPASGGAR